MAERARHLRIGAVLGAWIAASFAAAEIPHPEPAVAAWEAAVTAAEEAARAEDFELALSSYEQALRRSASLAGSEHRVRTLEAIATLLDQRLRRVLEALPYRQEAWKLRLAAGTSGSREGRRTRAMLRSTYNGLGDWAKTEPLAREKLRLAEAEGDSRRVIYALQGLARTIDRLRPDDPEVEELLRRSIAVAEATDAAGSSYSSAAYHYGRQGRHREEIELLQRAIDRLHQEGCRDLEQLASNHGRLARAYSNDGRPELAVPELRQALALREAHYGAVHPKLVRTLRDLGAALAAQRLYAEAVEPIRRAVAIAERAWDADSADAVELRRALAELEQRSRGGSDGGEPIAELAAGCDCGCSDDPEVDDLRRRGRWHQALELAQERVDEAAAEHGSASLEVAAALQAVGSLLRYLDAPAAVAAYERRLEILGAELALADGRIAATAEELAHLYRASGDVELAAAHYRLRIESLEAAGNFTATLAEAFVDLAFIHRGRGDPLAAAESFELAAGIWLRRSGELAPETLQTRRFVADAWIEAEDYRRAEEILLDLVAELEGEKSSSKWVDDQLDSCFSLLQQVFQRTGRAAATEAMQERRRELP